MNFLFVCGLRIRIADAELQARNRAKHALVRECFVRKAPADDFGSQQWRFSAIATRMAHYDVAPGNILPASRAWCFLNEQADDFEESTGTA